MSTLNEWLTQAPRPEPLPPRMRWHVFVSYRSIHRPWAIQLYDILRAFGYEVFLDQYVLSSASPLIESLEEGLRASASGILIWSSASNDSVWCKREYQAMEFRRGQDPSFHYAVAVLDGVRPPEFAAQTLYFDFTAYRSGPQGKELMGLLFSLQGRPLSSDAVRLATQVDEETRHASHAITAAAEAGNHQRLLALAGSRSLPWLTSPQLGCLAADGLIRLQRNAEALSVLDDIEKRFPRAIRPKQLKGLALARSGEIEVAQAVLGELYQAGERDPETLGIYARTWMDRHAQTGSKLYLRKSRELYAQAFLATPSDLYTGINAATKSVLLGEIQQGRRYAKDVEKLLDPAVSAGYWNLATAAEARLILDNYEQASALYLAAVASAPDDIGSHQSTRTQARRLMDALGATPEQRTRIERAFAHLGEG